MKDRTILYEIRIPRLFAWASDPERFEHIAYTANMDTAHKIVNDLRANIMKGDPKWYELFRSTEKDGELVPAIQIVPLGILQ